MNQNLPQVGDIANQQYKHGTTTVGLKYKDGVVVAADKRASMGYLVASPNVKKILPLDDYTVLTLAGLPSDAVYLAKVMIAEMSLYELGRGRKMSIHAISNLFSQVMYGQFRTGLPYFVQIIIAGVDKTGAHVFNYDGSGSITDDAYTSTGSGSPYAYGVFEAIYQDDMEEADAVKTALTAVRSAIIKDIASGDGFTVFVINKDGSRELTTDEIRASLGDKYPFP